MKYLLPYPFTRPDELCIHVRSNKARSCLFFVVQRDRSTMGMKTYSVLITARRMVRSFFFVNNWPIWHPLITCSAAPATIKHLFSGNTEYNV